MNIKLNKFDKVCPSCKGSKMCSRCGGSGKHSYNLRDRDICFGCAGAKNCSRCGGSGIKRFYARDPNNTYFYISTGEKNKIFCLKSFDANVEDSGDIRLGEKHEIVLCTDPNKAIEKAKAYLEEIYPNEEKLPKLFTDGVLDAKLSTIIRRTKEEIEMDKEREKMKVVVGEVIRKSAAFRKWNREAHKKMDEGFNPFKDYYRICDMSLLEINSSARRTKFKSNVHKRFSDICKSLAIHIPANANKHLGLVGEKIKVRAMLLDLEKVETDWGENLKLKWVTEDGERFITNGKWNTAFNKKIDDEYLNTKDDPHHRVLCGDSLYGLSLDKFVELEATIKAHNSFDPSEECEYSPYNGKKIIIEEGDGKVIYKTTKLIRPRLIS
tara:strand:- start:150 stop:1292 length:1143 start_codon:yes stop_codon:yes gene_type:complete